MLECPRKHNLVIITSTTLWTMFCSNLRPSTGRFFQNVGLSNTETLQRTVCSHVPELRDFSSHCYVSVKITFPCHI
jgi:hypothetical protein